MHSQLRRRLRLPAAYREQTCVAAVERMFSLLAQAGNGVILSRSSCP